MDKKYLKKLVSDITADESISFDERIDRVFAMRRTAGSEDSEEDASENLRRDIVLYDGLIEMLLEDNGPHIHDLDLLQLYTLLAEAYVELEDFRPLAVVADGVLELTRHEATPWKAIEDTFPRILDAVGESVYNHALYELYVVYIRDAYRAGELDERFKGRARKLLKLMLLLDAGDWLYYFFDKELQNAVAALFTPAELVKIMVNPAIGHLRKDPVEYTRRWEEIYYDVEDRLNERFANAPRHMGFCFHFWNAKRELLREEYNIDWQSPAQMNPHVIFD